MAPEHVMLMYADEAYRKQARAEGNEMYFFFAVATAGLYAATARPGMMRDQDIALIVAVAVFSMLGLVDHMKRH